MISDEEALRMWIETGCVPIEYVESVTGKGFSTTEGLHVILKK